MDPKKYLLFDWDGCLADTLSIWLAAYHKVFEEYGVEATDETIVAKAFGDWNAAEKFGISDVEGYAKKLADEAATQMYKVELNGDVKRTFEMIKSRGGKIAIVTSSLKPLVWPAIEKFELDQFIDVFLSGEDVVHHKPDPEIVEASLERMGGDKKSAAIIGDSDKDVEAGKNAQITTMVYYPQINEKFYSTETVEGLGADYVFRKLDELLRLI